MKTHFLKFINPYIDKNFIYAGGINEQNCNILFRIDRKTNKAEYLTILESSIDTDIWQTRAVYKIDNRIFAFSRHTHEVASYNLDTGELEYFSNNDGMVFHMLEGIQRVNDEVWLLNKYSDSNVYIFSLKECSFKTVTLDISHLQKIKDMRDDVGWSECYVIQGVIWRLVVGTNKLYSIECHTKKICIYEIPIDEKFDYMHYDCADNNLYLFAREGNIVRWDVQNGIIDIKDFSYDGRKRPYRAVISYKERKFYIPCRAYNIAYVDGCGPVRFIDFSDEFVDKLREWDCRIEGPFFCSFNREENVLELYPFMDDTLITLDLDTLSITYSHISFPSNGEKALLMRYIKQNPNVLEREFGLSSFLSVITEK